MNIDGFWFAIGWLFMAFAFLRWLWISAEAEIPAGVTIIHTGFLSWDYWLDDTRGMVSTGYWTRAAAIRAANAELQRLHERDNAQ